MNLLKETFLRLILLILTLFFISVDVFARVGGAGGEKKEEQLPIPGGSGGVGKLTIPGLIGLAVVLIIYFIIRKRMGGGGSKSSFLDGMKGAMSGGGIAGAFTEVIQRDFAGTGMGGSKHFPEGLTEEKVSTSFMALQEAWEKQDLSKVRKWMSDGVYQRFTAQFSMMKQLTQRNTLSNIRIHDISVMDIRTDGMYQSADVAITFSMDDRFVSEKYPELNESYKGDSDKEIWTFIKRKDTSVSVQNDLYLTNNCPNCGSSLDNQLGEVSRCSNCKTLTNNASFDWVLNEITQDEDYKSGNDLLQDMRLKEVVKNDSTFAIQRMEDIASNVFMQVMEVWSGDTNKKLARFSDQGVADKILTQKQQQGEFVFDRLYLKEVTLQAFDTQNNQLNLSFRLTSNYQRVQVGKKLNRLDSAIAEHSFRMVLSKDLAALSTPEKEIAFSYECANCGAPYEDTTHHTCSYCDALVVDPSKNWVLTQFEQIK